MLGLVEDLGKEALNSHEIEALPNSALEMRHEAAQQQELEDSAGAPDFALSQGVCQSAIMPGTLLVWNWFQEDSCLVCRRALGRPLWRCELQ